MWAAGKSGTVFQRKEEGSHPIGAKSQTNRPRAFPTFSEHTSDIPNCFRAAMFVISASAGQARLNLVCLEQARFGQIWPTSGQCAFVAQCCKHRTNVGQHRAKAGRTPTSCVRFGQLLAKLDQPWPTFVNIGLMLGRFNLFRTWPALTRSGIAELT